MANPRKFSEKIALHTQKQAEETAAFEAVMRDVAGVSRQAPQPGAYHQSFHNMGQPYIGKYIGGSLPNVNQLASSGSIDLQGALHNLEDMKHSHGRQMIIDRLHNRERSRQARHNARPFHTDKRMEPSPYSNPYLSPPHPNEWRRVNSDSALHTSVIGPPQSHASAQSATSPPTHRRVAEVANDGSMPVGDPSQYGKGYWEQQPKKNTKPWMNLQDFEKIFNSQRLQSRPKSCGEVPGINIYPSADQDNNHHVGPNIPISNNTGSLPDLTNLHFPSPLATPLDVEDQNYAGSNHPQGNPSNLSPTSPHAIGMNIPVPQSPNRRRPQVSPSPLVLGSPTHLRHSVPGSSLGQHKYQLYRPQRSPRHLTHQKGPHLNNLSNSQGSISQYRNGTEHCQSPTSPLSQHSSCSPLQSPGLPPQASNPFSDSFFQQQQQQLVLRNYPQANTGQQPTENYNMVSGISDSFSDAFFLQQQQPTDHLQQKFESANLLQDNHPISTMNQINVYGQSNLQFSQANNMPTCLDNAFFSHQQNHTPHMSSAHTIENHRPQHSSSSQIPDIVLTGADESSSMKQDFAKELSNAMTFDSDFFPSDESLKAGLDPLDFDGLQILSDPSLVADAATEDSFRLDRL